ncbi:hypothetical protein BCR43DRAFT_270553 [Syncephalastrum racemosum]|uniref:Polysaccharide lyase 14 domain-containing protein n=1 Tax=Syncephalastrum racemosum TaxID=13706 RepID=A0A1X2HBY7_SYNRA|nr:hypothetical protein BCR43DRAFT_270553 [Syncephalastrum racemosum]
MITPRLALLLGASLVAVSGQQLSQRAQELGLKETWSAPMGSNDQGNLKSYLTDQWSLAISYMYGENDVKFVGDPITNNASDTVMEVLYAAGSYAPSGSKSNSGSTGGTEFYTTPDSNNASYDSMLLRYDLAFASNFDWVLGGKLPGLFGGPPGKGCSGGNKADGSNCFSSRLMWRQGGSGEAYAYIPDSNVCSDSNVQCNDEYGVSFSRGVIQFKTNQWTTLEMYVKVNNASKSDGILQVWQDGSLKINQQNLQYRTSNAVALTSMMFSTFFGGGSTNSARATSSN